MRRSALSSKTDKRDSEILINEEKQMKAIHRRLVTATASMLFVAAPALSHAESGLFGSNASPGPYTPITQAMMEHSPDNWLTYRGNYAGWDYSPLDQINTKNVSKLELAWSYSTGTTEASEAPPIVNNGYMFVSTPNNNVIALNAKTGQELWRYSYQGPEEQIHLHPTNRGVALWGSSVYLATQDCKLVSLDAATGKVNWTVEDENWKDGYYATLAPLAVKGKILMGCSGGETGVRGSVTAFDAKTGKRLWRSYNVPAPGEPGSQTWPNDAKGFYEHGGGSIWETGSYDPETNITYWGTGNAGPWPADYRPGDNLFTNAVVGLDLNTGKRVSYFQYDPNDAHDWDEVSTPLLIKTDINGKETKTLVHAARNGYIWQLSQTKTIKTPYGKLLKYIKAWPFANNNTILKINPVTGYQTDDPAKRPGLKHGAHYCPSAWGGKDWQPEAYSPETKLLYVPANVGMCGYLPQGEVPKWKENSPYIGFPLDAVLNSITIPKGTTHLGELQAWDLSTHKLVWKHEFDKSFMWGPVTATAGGLVLTGGTVDRMFRIFDAKTGEVLWKYPTPSGLESQPVVYRIDGVEYIAIYTGWGVDGERVTAQLNHVLGAHVVVPQGGVVMVFRLGS